MTPEEAAAHLEVTRLLTKYVWALDTKDFDALDDVFTPDATVDYSANPGGAAGTWPEMKAWLAKTLAAFPATQHLLGNVDVTFDGDRATSRAAFSNPMGAATPGGGIHWFTVLGEYHDRLVRTPDGWRITERVERNMQLVGELPSELVFPDDA